MAFTLTQVEVGWALAPASKIADGSLVRPFSEKAKEVTAPRNKAASILPVFLQKMVHFFPEEMRGSASGRDEIRPLPPDWIAVSQEGLRDAGFSNVTALAKQINEDLDNAAKTSKDPNEVTLKGVRYIRGKNIGKDGKGRGSAWGFDPKDKEKVAKSYGAELQIDLDVKIESLNLEEAVALLGSDPLRLQQYIRIYHPELSQEEADRIVVTSLEGLKTRWPEAEELHKNYRLELPIPQISQNVRETEGHSFILSGSVRSGIAFVQVVGAYTRKIRVREDGGFQASIPLPQTGEANVFEVYAVDEDINLKSPKVTVEVRQTGEKEDVEESFLRLLALKEDVLEKIAVDPARYRFILRATEQSLLKHFTYDEKEGLGYLQRRISREKSSAQKAILEAVLRKFTAISQMPFALKNDQRPYFFQKYTIAEARALMKQGLPGVIIANEQGTGKTLIALLLAEDNPTVILTPNSVVSTWAEQEAQFLPEPKLEVLEGSYGERQEALRNLTRPYVVTNIEFTRGMNQQRQELLSRPEGILIVDEGDYLGSAQSQQAQGTRQLRAGFKILLTATPFKRPSQITRLLEFLHPEDPTFKSQKAFARAFSADERESLNALFLLLRDHTIRIRKRDVFEEYDPSIPLEQQSDRLPGKIEVPLEEGQFYLSQEQCDSIFELFTRYRSWCRRHDRFVSYEDQGYARFKEGFFNKKEALRQIMNDPAYIGRSDLESPKHLKMDEIVEKELGKGPKRKVLIFCRYQAEVKEYSRRYEKYGARSYYGGLLSNPDGYKIDPEDSVLYYRVDDYGNFILDSKGRPTLSDKTNGRLMRALDYERILFQNNPDSRVMIATYDTGALGVTFTAADAVIYDDLAPTYRDEYQAGDRAHRIDNKRKKYNVTYYWLQALYPESFLRSLPEYIQRSELGGGSEDGPEEDSEAADVETSDESDLIEVRPTYFDMGTFDQIHYENLRRQARLFHRIMDGIGSDEELTRVNEQFMRSRMSFLFQNGDGPGTWHILALAHDRYKEGLLHLEAGRYEEAIQALTEAIGRRKGGFLGFSQLVDQDLGAEDQALAEEFLEEAERKLEEAQALQASHTVSEESLSGSDSLFLSPLTKSLESQPILPASVLPASPIPVSEIDQIQDAA